MKRNHGFQLASVRNRKIGFVFQTFSLLTKASLLRDRVKHRLSGPGARS